jgi:hypothetical protein
MLPEVLTFEDTVLDVIDRGGKAWLRAPQIEGALGYEKKDAISQIYSRNADEFSDDMTAIIRLQTAGGVQDVRIFSLRGAHLLGMLARTERAKAFRRWVLDILDRIATQPAFRAAPPAPAGRGPYLTGNPAHTADQLVSADRIFRSMLRTARSAGLPLRTALRQANEVSRQYTGVDLLEQIEGQDLVRPSSPAPDTSAHRFAAAWLAGELPVPAIPCRSTDLYQAYLLWYSTILDRDGAPYGRAQFIHTIGRRPDARHARMRHYDELGQIIMSGVFLPVGYLVQPTGQRQQDWLSPFLHDFIAALAAWQHGGGQP